MSAQTPIDILKEHSLRVTEPRLAVLGSLIGGHAVFTLEQIHQKCGADRMDFATVFRSIQKFLELGIVERVELGDGQIRYELCNAHDEDHHHHHHVVCRSCGKIEAIPDATESCGVLPEYERALKAMGYRELNHRLEFTGLCKACR